MEEAELERLEAEEGAAQIAEEQELLELEEA